MESPLVRRWILRGLVAVAAGLVVLSLPWRPAAPSGEPRLVQSFEATGALSAGAGRASLVPPVPSPIGGFSTRGNAPFEGVLHEPAARALVVEVGGRRVAFVSAELVVLPASLREKVLAAVGDLELDTLLVAATHTHAGPGGYWDRTIAEWIGLGAYDGRVEAHLVERVASALRDAAKSLRPARVSSGSIVASNYAYNRAQRNGPTDPQLTALRLDAPDGAPLARLVLFAAHPTILHRDSMQLSGDWPGAFMRALELDGATTLFWQGAVGDQTWGKRQGNMTIEERVVRFGQSIAGDARGAIAAAGEGEPATRLAFARVKVPLPGCDAGGSVWGPFEPAAANLLQWMAHPGATEVSVLRLGSFSLAAVPGEPVAELGLAWRKLLGVTAIAGLVDDYVGYVETPERFEAEQGEAQRQYFGSGLAPALFEGLSIAGEATKAK